MIEYDKDLMERFMMDYFREFQNKAARIQTYVYMQVSKELGNQGFPLSGAAVLDDELCVKEFKFIEMAVKYHPMRAFERDAITTTIKQSIATHVTHVLPVTLK
jgi:hypothetical protein